ncbi:MAG TPA: HAD-IIB family hydrolase [Nitrososphaeraceae archaeon]|nr:HAD-IIB family hydrolase [Nitrososphaeraceae archaeon]
MIPNFFYLIDIDKLTNSYYTLYVDMTYKVIFTDIDGTLIDINTGEYQGTIKLVCILKNNNIPVILCSAKTWSEQNKIREDIGLNEPFIVENGGALIIPKGYFNFSFNTPISKVKQGYSIIELGKSAIEIRTKLDEIRKKYKIDFLGVSDVSLNELAKMTGLSKDYARRMAQREYGETIIKINKNDLERFIKIANGMGLKLIHGGRFFDITVGNDKGKAVDILMNLFRKKYHNNVKFFGVGDSENDVSMLNRMDLPMLVQRPDRSWSNLEVKDIVKVQGIGPEGWKDAFNRIMESD